jgi:hypothetical protein
MQAPHAVSESRRALPHPRSDAAAVKESGAETAMVEDCLGRGSKKRTFLSVDAENVFEKMLPQPEKYLDT